MPAVDSHAHAFDLTRQGWGGDRGFDIQPNELGTARQFLHMLSCQGFTHGVLINPLGGYGANNTYMLEAIAEAGGRLKGVALLPDATPEAEIRRMVEGGIVGIRFNLDFPTSPPLLGSAGERALARARELGWFAQIHYHHGESIIAALPVLRGAGLPVIIDHSGRPELEGGLGMGLEEGVELPGGQDEAARVGHGLDAGGAGGAVEDGHLAHDVAGAVLRDLDFLAGGVGLLDADAAGEDDEEADAALALLHEVLAGLEAALGADAGDALEEFRVEGLKKAPFRQGLFFIHARAPFYV